MTSVKLAVAALMLAVGPAASAQWTDQFVIIKGGKDTLAVESFTRDPSTLSGQLVQNNGLRIEYLANLTSAGRVEHLEWSRTPTTGLPSVLSVDFGDTLVSAVVKQGEKEQKLTLTTLLRPNPYLQNSLLLYEQLVRSNRVEMGKTVRVAAVRLGAGDTATVTLTRPHADSVVVDAPNGAMRMRVSADGDVLGAIFPSQQWVIVRRKP